MAYLPAMIINALLDVLLFLYSAIIPLFPTVSWDPGVIDTIAQFLAQSGFIIPWSDVIYLLTIFASLWGILLLLWVIRLVKLFLPW